MSNGPDLELQQELQPFISSLFDFIEGVKAIPSTPCDESSVDPDGVTRDASTLNPLSPIVATSDADVRRALTAAAAFHHDGSWARKSLTERQVYFDRLAHELDVRAHLVSAAEATDIGAVRELCDMAGGIGKKIFTRDLSKLFVDHPAEKHVMVDDEQVATLQWIARGPAVVICPSNGPVLSSLVQAGMAMQAGCPVIIKPSPWSPHSFNVVADALAAADLPSGLVQIVQGGARVGRTLVESPLTKTVCFTGAVAAGLKVAETCARSLKPYVLELGGSNPFVVMADADLDAAASALLEGLITVNGTYCCGPGRVFVHADVHDRFLDIVGDEMKDIRIGLPMDTATKMGPVCVGLAKPLLAKLEQMRKENPDMSSFAKTPIPKDLPEGHFMAPTLLLNAPTMSADELFGPVATLTKFTTHAEIVSMTHAAQSRLKGFIFGKDEAAVRKVTNAVECAWWDWNVFQMGTPGIKSVGFAGLSGCNDLTPDVFMYSRYIARPHNQ